MKHSHQWIYSLDHMGWICDCGMATINRKEIITKKEARASLEEQLKKRPSKAYLGDL